MEKATPDQAEFILSLLEEELETREKNRIARLVKKAGFGTYKTFSDYSPDKIAFPIGLTFGDVCEVTFIENRENLVLYGPVGTGKTHLAIAAGIEACNRGFKTRFFSVASLVRQLTKAQSDGKLDKLLSDLRQLDLLILDEWGYVPIDREGAQLLFQVTADSYEQKSMIITTNLEFGKWGSVLTDEQMAAAIIDRLVHHGHLLTFSGSSYRLEHALMRQNAASKSL